MFSASLSLTKASLESVLHSDLIRLGEGAGSVTGAAAVGAGGSSSRCRLVDSAGDVASATGGTAFEIRLFAAAAPLPFGGALVFGDLGV